MNPVYWHRFEKLLRLARERDIIVQIELWDRFDFARDVWEGNPYNPANNVNYSHEQSRLAARYPNHPGSNENPFFRTLPSLEDNALVLRYQTAQVDRMLSVSLDYPNVLYCIDNETSGKPEWGAFWAEHIRRKAREKGVEVQVTEMWDSWDLMDRMHRATFDHPELYSFVDVSQNNHRKGQTHWDQAMKARELLKDRPRPMNNVKVYGSDAADYGSTGDGIERFWRNIFAGMASSRFHRPPAGLGLGEEAQAHLRSARMLVKALDLMRCAPHQELLRDRRENEAYCLAEPGRQYAVLFPDGGEVMLAVGGEGADLRVRWLEVSESRWRDGDVAARGDGVVLKAPAGGVWVAAVGGRL